LERKEAYQQIVQAFEEKYTWLGRQFAEEFLKSVASWNLQQYSEPEYRIRRHILLYYQGGWVKSTMLSKAYSILGTGEYGCTQLSDVTLAALRGTVEANKFVVPYCLKRPFAVATEFGQVMTSNSGDIVQKLLNVLEEGVVEVSLAKLSFLPPEQREYVSSQYGINFLDSNTFWYKTNWVLMAATYNRKFLVDNAFQSRFNVIVPEKKLDSSFTKHVNRSKAFAVSEEAVQTLRQEVSNPIAMDCQVRLPDEVYNIEGLSVRDSASICSNVLCSKWWGINPTKDEIIRLANSIKAKEDSVWKPVADKVFDSIHLQAKSIEEIIAETGLAKKTVFDVLRQLKATSLFDGRTKKYRVYL